MSLWGSDDAKGTLIEAPNQRLWCTQRGRRLTPDDPEAPRSLAAAIMQKIVAAIFRCRGSRDL